MIYPRQFFVLGEWWPTLQYAFSSPTGVWQAGRVGDEYAVICPEPCRVIPHHGLIY